jgi:DHA3 family macrolide efflux protein-like MFS transporter
MENPSQNSSLPANWAFRFFTIWSGQAVSLFGSSLVQFALVWYLTRETGSATVLATATLVALLPQIVLGPFVGALVDRWDRRIIMIVADSSIAAATLLLAWLFTSNQIQVWHVFAILGIRSLGGAFHQPAMTASTSLMVPDEHLARVAGANQTLQGVLNIAAPPLGAILIETIFTQNVLLIDVVTAAFAVVPLFFIPIPQPKNQVEQANGEREKTSYWQDVRAGFRYVRQWPGLFWLIILAMVLNFLLGPTSSLLPLVITKIFNGGATELGWVESTFGIGVIVAGVLLSIWGGFKRRIITSALGIVGIGLSIAAIGLIPANLFSLLLVAQFFVGFSQVFANGPLHAIFQSSVAPEMQGRVFSLLGAGATAMMPIGLMIAGPLSDLVGIRFWFIFGGSICVLMIIAATFSSAIMNIETNNNENAVNQTV